MAAYTPWFERLKDPRWQKKRLEVMKHAGFECVNCGAKTETLHVHHTFYGKGLDPWDYPDWALMSLCDTCHKRFGEQMNEFQRLLGMLGPCGLAFIAGVVAGYLADPGEDEGRERPIALVENIEMDGDSVVRGLMLFLKTDDRDAVIHFIERCNHVPTLDDLRGLTAHLYSIKVGVNSGAHE